MTLEIILYISLIVVFCLALHWLILSVRLQAKNEMLEKQLTGNLTDFEKLEMITKVYRKVDLNKINISFLKDWDNIVQSMSFDIFLQRKKFKHESNSGTQSPS